MTTKQAAQALGLSQRQVQRLVDKQHLPSRRTDGGRIRIDSLGVDLLAEFPRSLGTRISRRTAWELLYYVSHRGRPLASWLAPSRARHLHELLAQMGTSSEARALQDKSPTGTVAARELAGKSHVRAQVRTLRLEGHLLEQVRAELSVTTGCSAAHHLDDARSAPPERLVGYVTPAASRQILARHTPAWDLGGNVQLHITEQADEYARHAPLGSVIAADMVLSPQPEDRLVGLVHLQEMIDQTLAHGPA